MRQHRRHVDVLAEIAPPDGRRVLEVGCGGGRLLRWIAARARQAAGVDPEPRQLAHARATATGVMLVAGRGEHLPFAGAAFDLVIYFNSLHHVAGAAQPAALAEARRVLAPNGRLLVCEPVAAGPWFELLRPLDDETAVRSATRELLEGSRQAGFVTLRTASYESRHVEANAAAAIERLLAASPARHERLSAARAEIERRFDALGERVEAGRSFAQPMRLWLLGAAA